MLTYNDLNNFYRNLKKDDDILSGYFDETDFVKYFITYILNNLSTTSVHKVLEDYIADLEYHRKQNW